MAGLTKAQRAERAAAAATAAAGEAPQAPAVKTEAKSKFVTIGCKVPMGVILRLQKLVPFRHPTPGGGFHEEMRSEPFGGEVVIGGCSAEAGKLPRMTGVPNIGGYALTHNVRRDFWEAWVEQNKDSPLLENHMLFCESDRAAAEDHAKDFSQSWSGMTGMVDKDPRRPKSLNAAVKSLETQDDTKNRPASADERGAAA